MYTLFISYRNGGYYCGVYPSLSYLHDVIKEMARDEEIPLREVPKISEIKKDLREQEDFWHEFSDTTWIHVQEVSKQLRDLILKGHKGEAAEIAIELKGGIVTDIYSANTPLKVTVIDHDNEQVGGTPYEGEYHIKPDKTKYKKALKAGG